MDCAFTYCASVALLDVLPTSDQDAAGSTPARSLKFFCGDLIMKYFLSRSLPPTDSRRAVVSFWQKNVHNTG